MSWTNLIKVCVRHEEEDSIDTARLTAVIREIHITSSCGSTPLHFVALGKNTSLALWLLKNGACIEENDDNETPLHWACKEGYLPMIKILLQQMTSQQIHQKDIDGLAAADWAEEYELSTEIISMLSPPSDNSKREGIVKYLNHVVSFALGDVF